jgi:hypothetical protein
VLYDDSVRDALAVAWEASGHACGKRLKTLLPDLVPKLIREGRLPRDLSLRGRLMAASAATIDRLLRPVRESNTAASVEERLEGFRASIAQLAHYTIPADLPPNERRHLELEYQRLLDELRRFAADNG